MIGAHKLIEANSKCKLSPLPRTDRKLVFAVVVAEKQPGAKNAFGDCKRT